MLGTHPARCVLTIRQVLELLAASCSSICGSFLGRFEALTNDKRLHNSRKEFWIGLEEQMRKVFEQNTSMAWIV